METKGLGAGSYPEPKDQDCYCVEITATIKGYKYIYADTEEEAYAEGNLITEKDGDFEITEFLVEEINNIKKA